MTQRRVVILIVIDQVDPGLSSLSLKAIYCPDGASEREGSYLPRELTPHQSAVFSCERAGLTWPVLMIVSCCAATTVYRRSCQSKEVRGLPLSVADLPVNLHPFHHTVDLPDSSRAPQDERALSGVY